MNKPGINDAHAACLYSCFGTGHHRPTFNGGLTRYRNQKVPSETVNPRIRPSLSESKKTKKGRMDNDATRPIPRIFKILSFRRFTILRIFAVPRTDYQSDSSQPEQNDR